MQNKNKKQFLIPLLLIIVLSITSTSSINLYFSINTLQNIPQNNETTLVENINKTDKEVKKLIIAIVITSLFFMMVGIFIVLKMYTKIRIYTNKISQNEKELEIAQSVANMGSWIFNVNKNELLWSKQSYVIFEADYNKKDLTSDSFMNFIHPEDKEIVQESLSKSIQENVPFHLIHKLLLKSGKEKVVEAKAEISFHKDSNGVEQIVLYGTVHDITVKFNKDHELKEKERLLISQSKLAAMGEMIGNIAHQWRQPLSAISTASTGLIMEKEYGVLSDDKFVKTCNIINDNAQYLSRTIDDFRNFAKGERSKKVFNLKNDIESFLHLVEGSIKNHNITIVKDINKSIEINGYENELIQCLINIFNNSKDALDENSSNDENKFIFISTTLKDNQAIITIKDNGGGIKDDVITHIFEPYFTTKHKSLGTGLGLHMTYNLIVDGMQGSIGVKNVQFEYKSNHYFGAEFFISIPIK